jgi:hypothetical protein
VVPQHFSIDEADRADGTARSSAEEDHPSAAIGGADFDKAAEARPASATVEHGARRPPPK